MRPSPVITMAPPLYIRFPITFSRCCSKVTIGFIPVITMAPPLYIRFPITFSSCCSKVTIGFIPVITMAPPLYIRFLITFSSCCSKVTIGFIQVITVAPLARSAADLKSSVAAEKLWREKGVRLSLVQPLFRIKLDWH
jgi:hypothetical protein